MYRTIAALAVATALTACGDSSPGPLEGTWQAGGIMPHTTTFRSGETESMGMIDKVGYTVEGQSVLVTMKDGMFKGTAIRYTIVAPGRMQGLNTTYVKVGN